MFERKGEASNCLDSGNAAPTRLGVSHEKNSNGLGGGGGQRELEEEICSEAFLRRVTREENLDAVKNLALAVNTHVAQVTGGAFSR